MLRFDGTRGGLGNGMYVGLKAAFDEANAKGGIHAGSAF
jgi:ABC-type branched-subunit amino acid transport system substrate-binding protein